MNTRERILTEALDLFSGKGYDAISVRDIARAVGIRESSLYNHFAGKQAIFDSIVQEYAERAGEFFSKLQLTGADEQFAVDDRTVELYRDMTPVQFEAMAENIFVFYFIDEINVKLRKLLTIEQYRNAQLSRLFRQLYFDASIEYQTQLFTALMKAEVLAEADPYLVAIEFFAPIFLLFYKFDSDQEGLRAAKDLFLRHIRHFNAVYGR